ncbi:MAG: hypothetical protein WC117_00100 [Sphaerochaetaceae bacterium]
MSKLFANLNNNGLEESQDRAGGGGFKAVESDIYTGKIKAAYAGQSSGGAHNVSLIVLLPGGVEYKETVYITNKKGENFFLNKDDKTKKVPLPGFTIIDDICLMVTNKPLAEQDTEEKVINVYDFDAKKEQPKAVDMLTDLIGGEISLGILRELQNKNEKQGDEYVPTAEVVERNVINKVFHTETKLTVVEARAGADEAKFWDKWLEINKGKDRDVRKIKDGQAGKVGTPPKAGAAASAPTERKSLFSKK